MRRTAAVVPATTSPCATQLSDDTPTPAGHYTRIRQIPERLAASLLLVASLPILGLLVVLIRITSRGPAIFRQTRVGRHGTHFVLYKLRTMRLDAEVGSGPVWSQPGDPRVTPLGKFLRWSHLDELPQLVNVLRGEMSLIGPRPERPEFTAMLAEQIPGYLGRLAVPPGITGLAQVVLPPDSSLESVQAKLELDLAYIQRAGCRLDLQILCCTALRLLGIRNRFARRLLAPELAVRETVAEPLPRHQAELPRHAARHLTATVD
jgi:lipopolysaccharide/colanic/teichoic acid biosynthesis glycosyltransferase